MISFYQRIFGERVGGECVRLKFLF